VLLRDIADLAALKYRSRTAVIDEAGAENFIELNQRMRRLADALCRLAEPGDRIAILSRNRREYIEAGFAVPTARMSLVLVNYRLSPGEMVGVLADSGATILLVEDEFFDLVKDLRAAVPSITMCVGVGGDDDRVDTTYEELLKTASDHWTPTPASADELAWLVYTSGTSGKAKGVMLSHRNLIMGQMGYLVLDSPPSDIELKSFPLCHISGAAMFAYVLTGTTLVLQRSYEPVQFMQAVENYGITGVSLAPTMIDMLLRHPQFGSFDLSSLRKISYGASSIPVAVLDRAAAAFPGVEFTQKYGMTEAPSTVFLDAAAHAEARAGRPELLKAAGRPHPFVATRIVDADGREVGADEVGELLVHGPQVMLGYWQQPEQTAAAFTNGWLHTGDLVSQSKDGYITIIGRLKEMIITGGENVYPREVEDVIARLPGVAEVAVVGLPDERWGETVCAFVVPEVGTNVQEDDIVAHCRAHLAGYKKPRRIVFIDQLPRNTSGKVTKHVLAAPVT
jgi:acyl-CoA synthetase (AMP-forming)/AMP-acid ligase II